MPQRHSAAAAHRPLTPADLLRCGPLVRLGRAALAVETIGSTNSELLRRSAELPDGAILSAESQNAGRGRLGRRWLAPRGSSLLFSFLFHEAADSVLMRHATMLGCVAACEAIAAETDCVPAVRWPNDITIDGRKVGGVLAETVALGVAASGTRALVLGIGLNCLQHAGHFPAELAHTATSLEIASSQAISRPALAGRLVQRVDAWSATLAQAARLDALRAAWFERCADRGTRATLVADGRQYCGTIVDIDTSGDLLVQTDDGARRSFAAAKTTRLW